jgi:hypothetical protein
LNLEPPLKDEKPDFSAMRKQKRRPRAALLQPIEPSRQFDSWRLVPPGLLTNKQWQRQGRAIVRNSPPAACVVEPRFLDENEDLGNYHVLEPGDMTLVSKYKVPLYQESQTKPYAARPLTVAKRAFYDIFHAHSVRDRWTRKRPPKDDVDAEILADCDWLATWHYMKPKKLAFYWVGVLNEAEISQHLNHGQIVSVFNRTGLTLFVSIDLDFRNRCPEIFLEMARILLTTFHGDTWFSMIRGQNVSGLNLFRVFEKAVSLEQEISSLRAELIRLDEQHPELALKAKAAGMKSFSELELYPTRPDLPVESGNKNAVRLPLSRGRWVALDRWVKPIPTKRGTAAPVEALMNWLADSNRKHMEPEAIARTLESMLPVTTDKISPVARQKPRPNAASLNTNGRKGREKELLREFWLHGRSHGRRLDTQILILARHAYFYGYRQDEAIYRIREMIDALPDQDSGSRKLEESDVSRIRYEVKRAVDLAYTNNSHQPDGSASTKKLQSVAAAFQATGFDPLRPATWSQPTEFKKPVFTWTDTLKAVLVESIGSALKCTDSSRVVAFIEAVVDLAIAKSEGRWGNAYFRKWAITQFPDLSLGNNEKRLRVRQALETAQIIHRTVIGTKRIGCSKYELGPVGRELIGEITVSGTFPSEDLGKGQPQAASQLTNSVAYATTGQQATGQSTGSLSVLTYIPSSILASHQVSLLSDIDHLFDFPLDDEVICDFDSS